jgi:hypothetical protein
MLVRALIGFAVLAAVVSLGAWVVDQRRSTSTAPPIRRIADRVHWIVGVLAIAVLAILLVGAVQLLQQ